MDTAPRGRGAGYVGGPRGWLIGTASRPPTPPHTPCAMLSAQQCKAWRDGGLLHVPDLFPRALVEQAAAEVRARVAIAEDGPSLRA